MTVTKWSEARTLADAGILTADWLEGRLEGDHPNGYDRPDEETLPLVPTLAAINRAGFLTLNSQPACREVVDGEVWEELAWVDGLVDDERLLGRLALEAWRFDLHVVVHCGPGRDFGLAYPVTSVDGVPVTWVGGRVGYDDVAFVFEGCHGDVVKAAVCAWQVTLVDSNVFGGGRLWRLLDSLSGRQEPLNIHPLTP